MTETFNNKTAVVTGAGGTLCSAIAEELARQGARVALIGRTREKLDTVQARITDAGGQAIAVPANVTDESAVAAAHQTIRQQLGPCDLLVNGAGGNQKQAVTTLESFSKEELDWQKGDDNRGFFNLDLDRAGDVVQSNTMGTVIPCQTFGRDMAERDGGAIVNFASMNSYRPLTRNAAYAMAKTAIVNFTEWLAVYLAPANVRVNAVAPGFFLNDRSRKIMYDNDGNLTERGQKVMAHTPMQQFGEPEHLLGAVCWLLDDQRAGYVTGTTVPIDGGFLACSGV